MKCMYSCGLHWRYGESGGFGGTVIVWKIDRKHGIGVHLGSTCIQRKTPNVYVYIAIHYERVSRGPNQKIIARRLSRYKTVIMLIYTPFRDQSQPSVPKLPRRPIITLSQHHSTDNAAKHHLVVYPKSISIPVRTLQEHTKRNRCRRHSRSLRGHIARFPRWWRRVQDRAVERRRHELDGATVFRGLCLNLRMKVNETMFSIGIACSGGWKFGSWLGGTHHDFLPGLGQLGEGAGAVVDGAVEGHEGVVVAEEGDGLAV